MQLAKNLVHIGLLLFNAQAPITDSKHNITIRVAQIVIALARQTIIGQKRVKQQTDYTLVISNMIYG